MTIEIRIGTKILIVHEWVLQTTKKGCRMIEEDLKGVSPPGVDEVKYMADQSLIGYNLACK